MFGADLLVAPVLREGLTEREVYLPKGEWFDFWTGRGTRAVRRIRVPVTLASHADLRSRRRVRVHAARRSAHG